MEKKALKLDEIGEKLRTFADNNRDQIIGGLALGAVGGGIGAMTADTSLDEDPEAARQHMIRNALVGSAAGGTIGWNLPGAAATVSDIIKSDKGSKSTLSKIWGATSPFNGGEASMPRRIVGALGFGTAGALGGSVGERVTAKMLNIDQDALAGPLKSSKEQILKGTGDWTAKVKAQFSASIEQARIAGEDLVANTKMSGQRRLRELVARGSTIPRDVLKQQVKELKKDIGEELARAETHAAKTLSAATAQMDMELIKMEADLVRNNPGASRYQLEQHPSNIRNFNPGRYGAGKHLNYAQVDDALRGVESMRPSAGAFQRIAPWSAFNRSLRGLKVQGLSSGLLRSGGRVGGGVFGTLGLGAGFALPGMLESAGAKNLPDTTR